MDRNNMDNRAKVRGRLGNREDIGVKVNCIGERIASPQDKAPKTFTEWRTLAHIKQYSLSKSASNVFFGDSYK